MSLRNNLLYPYNQVYDDLDKALSRFYHKPRKEAIEWQVISIIEKAIDLLKTNNYFREG